MKHIKPSICVGVAVFLFVALSFWLGGLDFTHRGFNLGCAFFFAVVFSILIASLPL